MAVSDSTIVLRSMRARLFSTVVTVVTVAVAVALMLVLLSMRDSGRRAFERGSGNMHLLVSADSSPLVSVLNAVFYANAPARPLTWTQYLRIAQDPRLAYAIPTQQGDSFRGFPVMATTADFFTRFSPDPEYDHDSQRGSPWRFAGGRAFEGPLEVVLGSRVWRGTGLRLGDRINLTHGMSGAEGAHVHTEYDFEVVGLLQPSGTAHDRALFIDLTNSWIMHARDRRDREAGSATADIDPEDLAPEEKLITGIYLRGATRGGRASSAVIPAIASELRANPQLTVAAPADEIRRLFVIVGQIDQVLVAMAGVVMASSGIAIMLALYNSMEQRRRQIAVLRVLGCSAAGIARLVLLEAAAIGVLGAALGAAVSLVGIQLVVGIMKQRLGLVIVPGLSPTIALAVIAGAVILAAVAGVIPAVMAYRTTVANNLRPIA